jgi:glutamate mutase epsilon subunit
MSNLHLVERRGVGCKINIEIDYDQALDITVKCLKNYYSQVEDANDDMAALHALDAVLSYFMTTHQYEDWANELRFQTPTV